MSDFFKSAFGLISGSAPGREENDFVGQIVEFGNQKLRVKRKIAEGVFLPHQFHQHFLTGYEKEIVRKRSLIRLLSIHSRCWRDKCVLIKMESITLKTNFIINNKILN